MKMLPMPPAPSLKTHKIQNRAAQDLPSLTHIIFNPPPAPPNVFHTPLKFLPEGDPRRKLYADSTLPSMYAPGQYLQQNALTPKVEGMEEMFKGGNVFKETARALGYGKDAASSSMPKALPTSSFNLSPISLPGTPLHSIPQTFPVGLAPRIPDAAMLPPAIDKARAEHRQLTQADVEEIRRLRKENPKKWSIGKLTKRFQCGFGIVRAIWQSHEAHNQHEAKLETVKQSWGKRKSIARMERSRRKELWERDA
jgi:hypothetical protein